MIDEDTLQVVTNRPTEPHESSDLKFAYAVCKHVKSNAIVLVKNGQTVGIGAGQMSRVESVEIALKKASATGQLNGSVCASDAFFPFKDSVEHLAAHGISAIIQPGGSKRDQESIDACNESNDKHGFYRISSFQTLIIQRRFQVVYRRLFFQTHPMIIRLCCFVKKIKSVLLLVI